MKIPRHQSAASVALAAFVLLAALAVVLLTAASILLDRGWLGLTLIVLLLVLAGCMVSRGMR